MGSEREREREKSTSSAASSGTQVSSTPPKLSFYPLPALRPDPPGMATPPVNIPGSVPFRWEEAPGKPKRDKSAPPRPPRPGSAAKSLDLPPRLHTPSPTTVLDGPYPLGQPTCQSCYSLSFAEGRSCKMGERRGGNNKERVAWSWRRGRRDGSWEMTSVGRLDGISSSSSSSSSTVSSGSGYCNHTYDARCRFGCGVGSEEEEEEHATTEVRITRIRRSGSTSVLPSKSTSHWLANLYENFRKVIPRKRGNKD